MAEKFSNALDFFRSKTMLDYLLFSFFDQKVANGLVMEQSFFNYKNVKLKVL